MRPELEISILGDGGGLVADRRRILSGGVKIDVTILQLDNGKGYTSAAVVVAGQSNDVTVHVILNVKHTPLGKVTSLLLDVHIGHAGPCSRTQAYTVLSQSQPDTRVGMGA